MIQPHGGKLVNRVLSEGERERIVKKTENLPEIILDEEKAKEVQNIAHGVFSPLEGFLSKGDFLSVLERGRLENGLAWTIPIVLDVSPLAGMKEGGEVALVYNGKPVAVLSVEDIYEYDKDELAGKVFGTTDSTHPGVAKVMAMKERLVGGKIDFIEEIDFLLSEHYLKPAETRALFKGKGWETVVGFQIRNVPHLGHEYCQKTALTFVDGLFINPVIGKKKKGDFRDEVIIETHKALIENYYPKDRAFISIFPLEMRYAGPREAIFHAIVRKNFGCTHFIVGRDHAGVGKYYPPYAAQEVFKEFPDLDITPLFFRSFFYCQKCLGVANEKTCPHGNQEHLDFSGTKIREMLLRKEVPPKEMMRPEVSKIILGWKSPYVD